MCRRLLREGRKKVETAQVTMQHQGPGRFATGHATATACRPALSRTSRPRGCAANSPSPLPLGSAPSGPAAPPGAAASVVSDTAAAADLMGPAQVSRLLMAASSALSAVALSFCSRYISWQGASGVGGRAGKAQDKPWCLGRQSLRLTISLTTGSHLHVGWREGRRCALWQRHQLADGLDGALVQVGGLQAAVVVDKQVHKHLVLGNGQGAGKMSAQQAAHPHATSPAAASSRTASLGQGSGAAHLRVAARVQQALRCHGHRVRALRPRHRLNWLEQQQGVQRAQLGLQPRPQLLQSRWQARCGRIASVHCSIRLLAWYKHCVMRAYVTACKPSNRSPHPACTALGQPATQRAPLPGQKARPQTGALPQ